MALVEIKGVTKEYRKGEQKALVYPHLALRHRVEPYFLIGPYGGLPAAGISLFCGPLDLFPIMEVQLDNPPRCSLSDADLSCSCGFRSQPLRHSIPGAVGTLRSALVPP